jgi:hypothetical protein
MELILRAILFVLGAFIVAGTVLSAVRTFVLPRSARDELTRFVFAGVRVLFGLWTRRARTYAQRDAIMALYAPVSLLALPPVWLVCTLLGYMAMFWALGTPIRDAFLDSGSSLLTLGFAPINTIPKSILAFSEATIGLILVALLIAYLPTMYSAFSRREAVVNMLDVRAGSPPSALEMIERYHRLRGLEYLHEIWVTWEQWFVDLEESHTSLAALAFFRSPQPDRSWITAAGAVLDGAALMASTLNVPHDPQVDLCIRAGYLALRRIADFFEIEYNPQPRTTDPISIARDEFDAAYDRLAGKGIPLKPDREQAWRDFSGWRVNYDVVLLRLCALTMAPYAPWSSDRSLSRTRPRGLRHTRRQPRGARS